MTYHKLIRLSAVLQKKHLDRYHIHVRRGFSKISPEVSGGVPAKRDLEINFDQDDVKLLEFKLFQNAFALEQPSTKSKRTSNVSNNLTA